MTTTGHPRADLSAYLDGALGPVDRAAVEAHLGGCPDCRARLGELRATASLIGALPDPAPGRRLVPRLAGPPLWLAPLRTLSTLASGICVFLFIASALLANVGQLATSGPVPAAAPEGGAALATAGAQTAPRVGFGAGAPSPSDGRFAYGAASAAASSPPAADAVKQASQPPSSSRDFAVAPAPSAAARSESSAEENASHSYRPPALGPSPWLWLGLAAITGAIAFALQRRLRSAG